MGTQPVSKETQKNWWVDATLFGSAIIAAISGIYFLYLPTGGYRGGRNPLYNVQVLFTRQTWDDLHTWGGVAMIAVAIVHLAIHWSWLVGMLHRTYNELTGRCECMDTRGRWNLILNITMGLSFVLTAFSGVYFLFFPRGRGAIDTLILFARFTWDLIHAWAGVVLISAAILHIAIHWKWVTKVTGSMLTTASGTSSASTVSSATNS